MQKLERASYLGAGYLHHILITLNLYRTRYILYDCVIFPYRGGKLFKVRCVTGCCLVMRIHELNLSSISLLTNDE